MNAPEDFMAMCHAQALLARDICRPNPAVGALIANSRGQVLGEGHTQERGKAHAEVMAIQQAKLNGNDLKGATLYVSLEPCSHTGRTAPCCDAIVVEGIGRVVASVKDPNPLVSGNGFSRLRQAGIEVEIGVGSDEAKWLNRGFFSRMLRKRPWVRLKNAASLDGRTGLLNGVSQWITSAESRQDGHLWRSQACAILTGVGTVLKDDPSLDARLSASNFCPDLAIVDSQLRTSPNAKVFNAKRKVLIYTATRNPEATKTLQDCGATVIYMPASGPNGNLTLKVDLKSMLINLSEREINEVHVEAGHTLNGALIEAGLVDEYLVYLAPRFLGPGMPVGSLGRLNRIPLEPSLQFTTVTLLSSDIRLTARSKGSYFL